MTNLRATRPARVLSVAGLCLTLAGCQSTYYGTMERLGYHKRDLLVSRVESARDSQAEAKEQFRSALEEFASVVNFDGGDLQAQYDKLQAEYDRSEASAKAVGDRIDSVESVAEALFKEWRAEIKEYSSDNLRKSSQRKYDDTNNRYEQLIEAMRRVEKRISPVLAAFKDQVLFLKHNLNARALDSLQDELGSVESDTESLIREMEASIAEANEFIRSLSAG